MDDVTTMTGAKLKNKIESDFNGATSKQRREVFLRISDSMGLRLPDMQKNNPSCRPMFQSFIDGNFEKLYTFFTDPFSCLEHINEDTFYCVYFKNPFNGEYKGFQY